MKQDLIFKKFLKEQEKLREGNGKIKKQIRNKTSVNFWEN